GTPRTRNPLSLMSFFVLDVLSGLHSRDAPSAPPNRLSCGPRDHFSPLHESRLPRSVLGVPHGGGAPVGGWRTRGAALPAGQPHGRTALGVALEHSHRGLAGDDVHGELPWDRPALSGPDVQTGRSGTGGVCRDHPSGLAQCLGRPRRGL